MVVSTCVLICSEDKVVIEELYFIAAVRLTKKSEGSTNTGVIVIPCLDFKILFLIDSLVASEIVKDENGFKEINTLP